MEGLAQCERHPYGAIPILLYAAFRRTGLIGSPTAEGISRLEFNSLEDAEVIQHTQTLGAMATKELVEPIGLHTTDAAVNAAIFYRTLLTNEAVNDFDYVIGAADLSQ